MKLVGLSMFFATILFSLYAGIKSSAVALEIVSMTFATIVAFGVMATLIRSLSLSHAFINFAIRLLEGLIVSLKRYYKAN
jgi:hypothetical protein